MRLIETAELSIKNLLSSKVRSLLTMLGIIIGVGAVILITALGNGMETYMTDSFKDMGTNLLTVTITGTGSSRTLDEEQLFEYVDENPQLFKNVSPSVGVNATVKIGSEELEETSISGIAETYRNMNGDRVTQGRYIQYGDLQSRQKIAVIGSYINETYFGGQGLKQEIKLNGNAYTIVGILEETADSEEGDGDDAIYIPYTTAMKLSGTSLVRSYTVEMVSEDQATQAKEALGLFLYDVYKTEDAYNILSMAELLDTMSSMINIMVVILAAIAAISLVVGGIGIMNITLVSVSERTREIGIRKSLGAKQRHIMQQFVIEAAVTSAVGGIIGIILGYLMSAAGTTIIGVALGENMKLIPTVNAIMMAFGVSVTIGIVFGYLPAKKAAGLNPIDALRYD